MRISVAAKTLSTKSDSPALNQDAYLLDKSTRAFAVLDGVSGSEKGEYASRFVQNKLKKLIRGAAGQLERVVAEADRQLMAANQKLGRDSLTTLTLLQLPTGLSRKGFLINVGDSRAYRYRRGRLTQLTVDDDLLALRVNLSDSIPSDLARLSERRKVEIRRALASTTTGNNLDSEELWFWGQRGMITNILGRGEARIKLQSFAVQPKDILLLTTDGIHDNLTPRQLSGLLAKNWRDVNLLAANIVKTAAAISQAHLFRSKPDDITVLVVKFGY